ncbi:MAG: hypothetical protein AAFO93_07010 [Pseudomonadota bacterium]
MLAFIISVAAGYAARFAREPIEGVIENILLDKVDISTEDSLALSYALCMLLASFFISVSGSGVPVVTVLLGGLLGLFAKELYTAVRKQVGS